MEESKLNFNTPLMSVRRFSTSGCSSLDNFLINRRRTLPPYNSGSNMEQATEPVAVPFVWEQIPGIAKSRTQQEPQDLDEVFEKISEDRDLTGLLGSSEGCTSDGGDEMEGNGFLDDSDGNDMYDDAPESLSPAESVSFSFDYSVSSLSASDGSARKPCGTFLVDPQTRDLMISRFLPAARAMALKPPQYASQKQQQLAVVPYEKPEEVKREPLQDARTLPSKNDSNIVKKYHEQDIGEEDGSEDENDEVDDDYGIIRGKGCGLLSKLSLKSSLCLLNPIPGMKVRTKNSLSVPCQAKKSYKDGFSEGKTKPVSKNDYFKYGSNGGTLTPKILRRDKLSAGGSRLFNFSGELQTMRGSLSPFKRSRAEALYPGQNVENEKQPGRASQTPKLPGLRAKAFTGGYHHLNYSGELRPTRGFLSPHRQARIDCLPSQQNVDHERRSYDAVTPKLRDHKANPLAGGPRCFNLSGELQAMRDSVSPYRHSGTGAFSNQQSERSPSPLARVRVLSSYGEVGSITRNSSNFPDESRRDHLLQTSFGVEKTVCVDSINIARNSYSNSGSSKQEVWMEPGAKEVETPQKRTEMKEASSEQSGDQEFKPPRYSHSSTGTNLIVSNAQNQKGDKQVDLCSDSMLPRLKSPSQSWLHRTLPSVLSGTPFTPKKQSPRLSSYESKWETIVRSSNSHHDRVRYSEELITRANRKSK